MSNRSQNERGPGGPPLDGTSPYKRARPLSPNSSSITGQQRSGPAYYQDPRYGMAVAAVAAGGYGSIYRDPFQPTPQAVEQHAREVQYSRDRLPLTQQSLREAELQLQKQRQPRLLDYQPHASSQPGLDRGRPVFRHEHPTVYGQHYQQETMGTVHSDVTAELFGIPASEQQNPKRPRLAVDRPDLAQPLSIDVSQAEPKREPAYNPQVEAISPTLPPEAYELQKLKDEILKSITQIDSEVSLVEAQIQTKQKKIQQQEEVANKQKEEVESDEVPDVTTVDLKHQSIAQIIYAENRKKAAESHNVFVKLGPKVDLPLYNQPLDTAIYHENKQKFVWFKPLLIQHLKKVHLARKMSEKYQVERYDQLMQVWKQKLEKWENNPKKKAKDAKLREYFEKIFPELKKAREDKERLSRTRAGLATVYARSEAEVVQIVDGLQEQEEEERKMRSLAVIPPMLLDARQRRLRFINKNGLIEDCMEEYKERKYYNIWTAQEKQIFKEKYLQHPKNFGLIASFLEKKSPSDCVEYYYRSKKSENYKQMLRKQTVKKKRQQQKAQQPTAIITKEEGMEPIASSSDVTSSQLAGSSSSEETVNVITSSANADISLRQDTGALNVPSSSCVSTTSIKDNDDDISVIDDSSDDNEPAKGTDGEGGVHPCAICKNQLEHYGLSRPLTSKICELYGILQADLKPDMRICNNCWCKSVRRRYTQCPVPSCKTPKRKVKRLRPLPAKWAEIPFEVKEPIIKDMQLTDDINKCCSACFNRISRRITAPQAPAEHLLPVSLAVPAESQEKVDEEQPMETQEITHVTKWTEEEIELAKKGIQEHGKNWAAVAKVVCTKTENQCNDFWNNYKHEYNLDSTVMETKEKENYRTISICESVASTITAPSDGELIISDNEDNRDSDDSGTASAPSPRESLLEDRDLSSNQKPESSHHFESDPNSDVTSSLMMQKSLSLTERNLRSISGNDSFAMNFGTIERGQGDRQGPQSQQGLGAYPGSLAPSSLPTCRTASPQATGRLSQIGAMNIGSIPRQSFSPTPNPNNSNQSFSQHPGSRSSPGVAFQNQSFMQHSQPNSRLSHEVPIIRETNPTQSSENVIDFSQGTKSYSPCREPGGHSQPRRPSSALSEPGILTHRALSPHLAGLFGSRVGTPPADKKIKPTPCVRDLIHSAIERNLNQDTVQEHSQLQDRPRSTDAAYRPANQPMEAQDLRTSDSRKDLRQGYQEHRDSPYPNFMRDPREMRPDSREMRGTPAAGGIDLSMRQSDGVDKVVHGYKGDPRDFDPHNAYRQSDPYRAQAEDQQRKLIPNVTPPPAHSHTRSPFQMQEVISMKGRQEGMDKSQGMFQERQTLSPSVRVSGLSLPRSSSPYSPHGADPNRHSSKNVIPPPPPLINSMSRMPKSPPSSHMPPAPLGSIPYGTPVGPHTITTSTSSGGTRTQQQTLARGSITQGTPIRDTGMARGMSTQDPGAPKMTGQYDMHMMEQAQMRVVPQQHMYDGHQMDQLRTPHKYQYHGSGQPTNQQPEYSTKQTIMSDFATARQMRHQLSPTDKDIRDHRDQNISPRGSDHGSSGPGLSHVQKGYPVDPRSSGYPTAPGGIMYMQTGQQPTSSRVSPRPSAGMASPRDEKGGSSWTMAGQRPISGGYPASSHIDSSVQQYSKNPVMQNRPSITQGTGRQTVITDSRSDDRYRVPDSSVTLLQHHSPHTGQQEVYLPMLLTSDNSRSPSMHQDFRQQQQLQQYDRDGQEKDKGMKEHDQQMAQHRVARMHCAEDQQRLKVETERDIAQKMRSSEETNKCPPMPSQATDILKAFVSDEMVARPVRQADPANKINRSMTAACLIDAIIVHQINQSTGEVPTSTTTASHSDAKSLLKQQEPKSTVSQSSAVTLQAYRPQQHSQPGIQAHPAQGQLITARGQSYAGQPYVAGQMYPGQPYQAYKSQGQKEMQGKNEQQERKSPPASIGKKRWIQSPVTVPGSAAQSSSGPSAKCDPDSKPPSRPSSSSSGVTQQRLPQDSALRQAVLGESESKQMTLGEHINTIILMDYDKKSNNGPPSGKSFLSQINGSIPTESSKHSQATTTSAQMSSSVTSSTSAAQMENSSTWPAASSSTSATAGQSDGQNKTPPAFPGHKKFKWRQANEQATSTGPHESGMAVSQSRFDDPGSRSQEPDWTRQIKPDQSHSPRLSAGPSSPPGQADSSSNSSGIKRSLASSDHESSVSQNKAGMSQLEEQRATPSLLGQGQGHNQCQLGGAQVAKFQPHQFIGSPLAQMQQPSHSVSKSRTQSPVSSQMMLIKDNSHKHPRPEPREVRPSGSVVSTSAEMHAALHPSRQSDITSVSPSSSSQASPDQHNQDEDSSRGNNYQRTGNHSQSPVSSVGENRDQVHSSQHPQRKGRVFSRPRSRLELEEVERKSGVTTPQMEIVKKQRLSPSVSVRESGRATSSEKKGPKSEYDFPDSPDDEALGKLSSYIALSSSTRSPRRGVVDSSENKVLCGGESGRDGEGNVESSDDVAHFESKVIESGSGKDNEAQGFERFGTDQVESSKSMEHTKMDDQVSSQLGGPSARKQSLEADEGSNISQTSADSTDRLMIDDESSNIDSSSGIEPSSNSHVSSGSSSRHVKSSRDIDTSPHCSSELGSSCEQVGRQGHRFRGARSTYPQSNSDLTQNLPSGSNVQYSRRVAEGEYMVGEVRDQEPQPLLSSQYETLSDDEQS